MTFDAMPPAVRSVLDKIKGQAEELGSPAYLVGGVVRDRILGRPLLDVDLAVEGDAIALARAVASKVEAELRIHEEFGTAVFVLASGPRIDLARTRAEVYTAVAALPSVRPASLEEDLLRRDFTVNSMAVSLDDPGGPLIDPSDGRGDLESGLLRVHHDRSFLDDPTRIVRGVRFETRLGMHFEAATERRAREACAAGAVARLSSDRLRREVELLFDEGLDPESGWKRLADLGFLEAAGLPADAAGRGMLGRVARVLAGWIERHGEANRVGISRTLLGAALLTQARGMRLDAAALLGIGAGCTDRFEELIVELERPELLPHESAALLDGLELEELPLVEALAGPQAIARVGEYLATQRGFELTIDGSMLLARGFAAGTAIGEALRVTRQARLDGLITAGEELHFAIATLRGENRGA